MTKKTTITCALLGVACDLPAAQKTGGFLSYTANLGRSRCFQNFSYGYGNRNNNPNFNCDNWKTRTNAQHQSDVKR